MSRKSLVFIVLLVLLALALGIAAQDSEPADTEPSDTEPSDSDNSGSKDESDSAPKEPKPIKLSTITQEIKKDAGKILAKHLQKFGKDLLAETPFGSLDLANLESVNWLKTVCGGDKALNIFGISLTQCSATIGGGGETGYEADLSGLATVFDRFTAAAKISLRRIPGEKPNTFTVSVVAEFTLPKDFSIGGAISLLKNTVFDKLSISNPTIVIVTNSNNKFDLAPGITLRGDIIPAKQSDEDDSTASVKSALSDSPSLTLTIGLNSGSTSFAGIAKERTFVATAVASNFKLGDNFACETATLQLQTVAPFVSLSGTCAVTISDESQVKFSIDASVDNARSWSISGKLVAPIENAFSWASSLTIQKASILAAFDSGKVSKLNLEAGVKVKDTEATLKADIKKKRYSLSVTTALELSTVLRWIRLDSFAGSVPSITLRQVNVNIEGSSKAPSFSIDAMMDMSVLGKDFTQKTTFTVDKDKIYVAAQMDSKFEVGPLNVEAPQLAYTIYKGQPQSELMLSGKTSIWKFKNLGVNVGLVSRNGKKGFIVRVVLGQTISFTDLVPQVAKTPLGWLSLEKPAVQISSVPVIGKDGVSREGPYLQGDLVIEPKGVLGGILVLAGLAASVRLPLDMKLGKTIATISPKDIKIQIPLPFGFKTPGDILEFHKPILLTIGYPGSFGIDTTFTLRIPFDRQPILFNAAFSMDQLGCEGKAETLNEWRKPFGIPGIIVRKIYGEFRIMYKPFSKTGIPERLKMLGQFRFPGVGEVKLASAFDFLNAEYILYTYIEKFGINSITEILHEFGVKIPAKVLPEIGFRDIEWYIAPKGGNIGSFYFKPGYSAKGTLIILDQKFAEMKAYLSYTKGAAITATLKNFDIGPLKVHDCVVDVQLTTEKQYVHIKGFISIKVVFELFKRGVEIMISKDVIYTKFVSTMYTLELMTNPRKPWDLELRGTFDFTYINNLFKAIHKGIALIGKGISKVTDQLKHAKKARDFLVNQLKKIKLPDNCGGTTAAATLDYADVDDTDEVEALLAAVDAHSQESTTNSTTKVMFWRRIRRAFRRAARSVGGGFRRGFRHVKRGASRGFRHVKRAAHRGFRHVKRAGRRSFGGFRRGFSRFKRGVSRGFRHVKRGVSRGFRHVKRAGRRGFGGFRRGFSRFKRGVSRGFRHVKRGVRTGFNHVKRGAKTGFKHVKNGAKYVGKHAARLAKQLCNKALKGMKSLSSQVGKAVNKVNDLKKKVAGAMNKYVGGFLRGDFFQLNSITFAGRLAQITKDGFITISIDITIMGSRKVLRFDMGSVKKIGDIAKKIMKKIISK